MTLSRTIKAVIRPGDRFGFVAECSVIPAKAGIQHSATLDETTANLKEAVELHLEGEGPFLIIPSKDGIQFESMESEGINQRTR